MSGKLAGEITIVTGGSRGIGFGIVTKFLEEGSRVIILDFDISPLLSPESSSSKGEISSPHPLTKNSNVRIVQGDAGDPESWKKAIETAKEAWNDGDVTRVVNNAGMILPKQSTHDTELALLDKIFHVNLKAMFVSVQTIIPIWIEKSIKGVFVNITSTSASRPRPGLAFYTASKAASEAATKSLALEYAPHGIRFVGVAPVVANTRMAQTLTNGKEDPETLSAVVKASVPLGRICEPADVANMVAHVANQNESSFITGIIIPVDGGRTV